MAIDNRTRAHHTVASDPSAARPVGDLGMPMPPGCPVPPISAGDLTENETTVVLRTYLIPEHLGDPNVVKFIASYMRCRDVRQAAKECKLSWTSGHNLRQRPDIHACIEALTAKSVMKYGFDATEVIEKVKEITAVDPADIFNIDGTFKEIHQIPPEVRRAIKKFKAKNLYESDPNGMKVCVGRIIEIEFWDKLKASELLGREKQIFKETRKIEHDVTTNMASILLDSERRAQARIGNPVIDVTPQITGTIENDEQSNGHK